MAGEHQSSPFFFLEVAEHSQVTYIIVSSASSAQGPSAPFASSIEASSFTHVGGRAPGVRSANPGGPRLLRLVKNDPSPSVKPPDQLSVQFGARGGRGGPEGPPAPGRARAGGAARPFRGPPRRPGPRGAPRKAFFHYGEQAAVNRPCSVKCDPLAAKLRVGLLTPAPRGGRVFR